jgi:hypothetical protein
MPLSFMMPRPLKLFLATLLAAAPALLPAQTETSAKEDERMNALMRDDGRWREPRTRVSIGIRMIDSGGTINFGNLGERTAAAVAPASEGAADRIYDNGEVRADGLRGNEVDANGNQVPLTNGRYTVTNADGVVVQNLIGYQTGLTRNWNGKYSEQVGVHPGYVGFHSYSAISEGASLSKKQGVTGGLELTASRDFGRLGRRLHWGIAGGVTLNGINSKASGTIAATLRTRTDYYKVHNTVDPTMPYGTPSFTFLFDDEGNIVNESGYETTVQLVNTPDSTLSSVSDLAGGAQVRGTWQIKGAYLMVKVGPTLRAQLTDRFSLTASAGFAGAYAGTRYTAFEAFTVTSMSNLELKSEDPVGSTKARFLSGYYADLTLDFLANDRTGLFGGVTAQQLDGYSQTLSGRTAKIDLGQAVGLRGGVSIRF